MDNLQFYILWGSSGHAKVLASLIKLKGGKILALFDNDPHVTSCLDEVPLYIGVEGFKYWCNKEEEVSKVNGISAIGGSRGKDRLDINNLFRSHQLLIQTLIHPSASVCLTASIGQGSQLLAQSIISSDAVIGEACIINHGASVDHECVLGDGVHLAPSSTLCGLVKLGNNVMVGAGAIILPRLKIGENTIIGAGSVVTHNLPDSVVAVGNPARIIRHI